MNTARKPVASQRNTAKGRVPKSSGSGACARPSAAKGRRAGGSQGSARVQIVSIVRVHEWHEQEGRAPVVRSEGAEAEKHARPCGPLPMTSTSSSAPSAPASSHTTSSTMS
jgi:hypothetical protein